ncbi:Zn-dependent hydrolase, glyoxylase [Frankia sp. EI5c]|uniref:MBL fold metallo-hydrolase n=1 Tax=Frankia sp. EI5c TaxID=683316 RepID=UPI0007C2BCA1|nr:MBL fold metallo-hydrolase [Frankia sp. EI5c]OAA27043.1 Zn-dependent hydrolase, glyoxylase [Frankia sp. EI5c]
MSAPRQVTALAAVVLAPNPGPMTLEGTNTWILRAPGEAGCVVVDPGPDHDEHLARVAAAGPVHAILLTHGHADHSAGAATLHALTGARVRALDPAHRLGSEGLGAGDVIATAGVELRVLATPGHTADSLSFVLAGDDRHQAVLTGDTILGRGSTVVAHPDGRLGDYLASLRQLRELGEMTVLPGHGPELPAAGRAAQAYLDHRAARLDQVVAALAELGEPAGRVAPADVVRLVYADVDRALWPAAELSVRAQLEYLDSR